MQLTHATDSSQKHGMSSAQATNEEIILERKQKKKLKESYWQNKEFPKWPPDHAAKIRWVKEM